MKRKFFTVILCMIMVITAGAMVTGCGADGNDNSKENGAGAMAAGENTLVYGSQDYTAINPALFEHGEINTLLFAGLTAHDAENKVVPGLAENWDFDEERLTYTFRLRKGLTFHDGAPLTAADVKFTLEMILDEKNQSEIISNYTDIEEISCPDDLTVEIRLSQVNVAFPDYMTIGILPKHLLEGKDPQTDSFNQNPVGAGPYKLVSWDQGQSITMERFDGYYGGTPRIERVIFKIVPEIDARAMQLRSGEIDMAMITAKTSASVEKEGGYRIYRMKTADYRAIAYNFAKPLFSENPELAGILSYAVDREAIVESVLLGEGEAAYSPLQKGAYNNEEMERFDYNPQKTEQLLQEAGWTKGKSGYYEKEGRELAFVISAMADDSVRVDMAKMCAAQLQAVGVNATAEAKASLDWSGQDCCIIGWGSPFDPDDHTYKVFSSGAGDNYTAYENPAVDRLLEKARHTEDDDERKVLYGEFQEELTKAMPYSFIAYMDATYAVRENVKGVTENTVLGHHGVGIFWNIAEWEIQ
ncbi:ABC transporter substrate-binding protein [Anaerovoracaceae bacterium 42-11]